MADGTDGSITRAESAPGDEHSPDARSWLFYVNVILRHRYVVVGGGILAGSLVLTLSLLSAPRYRAHASFLPQEPSTFETGFSELATQLGVIAPRASGNSPQFYADLLISRNILRDVVLTEYQMSESDGRAFDLLTYFELSGAPKEELIDRAIRRLRRAMSVGTDRGTGVVRLSVAIRHRGPSVAIVQRFLELLNDYNLSRRQSQARAEREFVEQRLAEAKSELLAAEDSLTAFYAANRTFLGSAVLEATEARLQRAVQLRQELNRSLSQSYERARIEEVRNTPVITVIETPEQYVVRQPRHTLRKAFFGALAGALFVMTAVFVAANVRRREGTKFADYQEFKALGAELKSDLSRVLGRR